MAQKEIKCPICRKPTSWEGNPERPFCSERCRLIDLGNWASGEYSVPAEPFPIEDEADNYDNFKE
ncbi:MAG: DNA gyrase inhibitor YacG [Geobacter sp.]|nr:DNA gyrase inhibitor YacG [Geobacter sp.]